MEDLKQIFKVKYKRKYKSNNNKQKMSIKPAQDQTENNLQGQLSTKRQKNHAIDPNKHRK